MDEKLKQNCEKTSLEKVDSGISSGRKDSDKGDKEENTVLPKIGAFFGLAVIALFFALPKIQMNKLERQMRVEMENHGNPEQLLRQILDPTGKDTVALEDIRENVRRETEKHYSEFCRQLNRELPKPVGEYTTLVSATFVNMILTFHYTVDVDSESWTTEELREKFKALKNLQKEQIPIMFSNGQYEIAQKELCSLLRDTGMKIRFVFNDANHSQMGVTQFDYRDFMDY